MKVFKNKKASAAIFIATSVLILFIVVVLFGNIKITDMNKRPCQDSCRGLYILRNYCIGEVVTNQAKDCFF
jgi:hypothetical protein